MRTHRHKCPNRHCGHIWMHGDDMFCNVQAHRCPRCGTEQFNKYYNTAEKVREIMMFIRSVNREPRKPWEID
jgi:predicted  nucleic acid-binding Zn-ribbon protein